MASKREDKSRAPKLNNLRPEDSLIDFGDFEQNLSDIDGSNADSEIDIEKFLSEDINFAETFSGDIFNYTDAVKYDTGTDESAEQDNEKKAEEVNTDVSDSIEDFFDQYTYSDSKSVTDFVDSVSKAISGDENLPTLNASILPNEVPEPIQLPDAPWEEPEPEPDMFAEANKYNEGIKNLSIRTIVAAIAAILSLIITFTYEKNSSLPFGIESNEILVSGTVIIIQLISAFAGLDIIIRGISNICRAEIGIDSLLTLSGIFTVTDGMLIIARKSASLGLPFSCVFSVAITCYLFSEYCYKTAMRDTLKNASNLANPVGVINDVETLEDRMVVKKVPRRTEGFYRNIMQEDCAEKSYRFVSPIFLLVAVSLAAIASIAKQNIEVFLHALAAELAVAASFGGTLAYSLPLKIAEKIAERHSAYIAGWGGAQLIADSNGAILTDDDFFPQGTVGIENIIIYGSDKAKALIDASSMIIASGAGTAKCFGELLRQQKLSIARVYDFTFCESGGLQGSIRGEKVSVGNSGFMNLMGIRISPDKDKSNSIYLALSDKLYARFDLSYLPSNSVQSSLLAMVRTKISILFAVRDFNVTPATVRQKFKIPVENMQHLTVSECYNVTESNVAVNADCLALLGREGAGSFAAAISGAFSLRNAVLIATIVSIAGSVLGMFLLFSMFWFDASGSVTAGNVVTYLSFNGLLSLLLAIFMRKS